MTEETTTQRQQTVFGSITTSITQLMGLVPFIINEVAIPTVQGTGHLAQGFKHVASAAEHVGRKVEAISMDELYAQQQSSPRVTE